MGGIAGWIDFRRDLTEERGTVLTQLGTLAARGPDGESLWASPHAVLGHRSHRHVDEHGMAKGDADAVTVVVDGRVLNAAELRAELGVPGLAAGADAELIKQAYLRWGEGFAERLDGMCAVAVWDGRADRLTLVRDRLGVKPLYYYPTADGVLFGSEPKAILAHPLAVAEIDLTGLRELLAYTTTPGAGVVAGLRPVLPAGQLRLDRDGLRQRRYWQVAAAPHTDDLATTIRTARELLESSVERQIDGTASFGMLLSGGLDSSALAALAAGILDRRGQGPLHTYSLGYPDIGPPLPGPLRGSDDEPYAAAVAEYLRSEHTHFHLETGTLMDPVLRGTAVAAQQDMPVAATQFPTSLRMLCRKVARHTRVVVGGNRANIVFGSVMGMTDQTVLAAETYPWIASVQSRLPPAGLGTGLLAPDLLGKLDLPAYCADMYQADLARVPRLAGEDGHERRMREIYHLNLQGLQEFSCVLDDGGSSAEGVELRLPFCDHRLIDYMFNVPWSMKDFDGESKSILRSAVSGLLPESVLHRPPSQFPVGRDPASGTILRAELARVLADPVAPVRALLDEEAARRLIDGPVVPARSWIDLTDMELVLQVNQWLSRFAVRIRL
ncbi:asparagine synthase (glutamine-hydrolyzing) [Streptosporangium soli]|nr:asparagine synthase (glutamine-hydrolyzing) [Streptosporangium sp. KLBMP 9127]